ncbi:CopM family metallochaperone [Billgrantia saliphila]|uniref:CopM family metallochaperone n=1 Tax=Billgrantia saliphila TaxID=1848458 RepID=UPI000CE48210|nr:DUF305 domain-containing protein [Halomonas saliphila]
MSQFPAVRYREALAVILAGSALLATPLFASEERTDAQERIETSQDDTSTTRQDETSADESSAEEASDPSTPEGGESEEGASESETALNTDEAAPASGDGEHEGHGATVETEDEHADNPAVQAYREIAERMHADMQTEFSGKADVDFARGMIVHHQGAIDMARVALEHGEDPSIRDLAREVIETQEAEIAFLRDWLAQHDQEAEHE